MIRSDELGTTNAGWITEDNVPDPTPLPVVMGWKMILRPVQIVAKSKGGVLLPDKFRDDMAYLTTVGRIIAQGPLVYEKEEMKRVVRSRDADGNIAEVRVHEPWCKVGDYVTFGKFAGAKFLYKGVRLLLLNDDEVLFKVADPRDLDPSLNLVTS